MGLRDQRFFSLGFGRVGIASRFFVAIIVVLLAAISVRAEDDQSSPPTDPTRAKADTKKAEVAARHVRKIMGRLPDKLGFDPDGCARWCAVIRELTEMGSFAVPELSRMLDETEPRPEDNARQRLLAFTLRAIGDPRAVPALIRAIPKCLHRPGSDMGCRVNDQALQQFMQQHDLDRSDGDLHFGFGRPVREVFGALRELTGQRFDDEELYFVHLTGGIRQREMKRRLYLQAAVRWAEWWNREGSKHVADPVYAKVEIEDRRYTFPTGLGVQTDGSSSSSVPSNFVPRARCLYDLDTGRVMRWEFAPPGPRVDKWLPGWCAGEGIDIVGTEYVHPETNERFYAIRAIGMQVWELDKKRYEQFVGELRLAEPLDLGGNIRGDLLLHRDSRTGELDPAKTAYFVFITREGNCGRMKVDAAPVQPRDPNSQPAELDKHQWYYGARMQWEYIFHEPTDEPENGDAGDEAIADR